MGYSKSKNEEENSKFGLGRKEKMSVKHQRRWKFFFLHKLTIHKMNRNVVPGIFLAVVVGVVLLLYVVTCVCFQHKQKAKGIKEEATTFCSPNSNTIKILTYNISWESMTGQWEPSHALCTGKEKKKCQQNVASFINDEGPFDFILLQEASEYSSVIDLLDGKKAYNFYQSESGREDMVTLWNKDKYNLQKDDVGKGILGGEKGRPYQILPFEEKILLMNIHAGHKGECNLLFILNELKYYLILHPQYNDYRIIIGGDFNHKILEQFNEEYQFEYEDLPRFYIDDKHFITCCIGEGENTTPRFWKWENKNHVDFIIDTAGKPTYNGYDYEEKWNQYFPASDHLPVVACLKGQ